jgi:hypothetical protein
MQHPHRGDLPLRQRVRQPVEIDKTLEAVPRPALRGLGQVVG